MGENLDQAFVVLIAGMITVFIILWLVVTIGNVLIRITNKFMPAVEETKKAVSTTSSTSASPSAGTIAAIAAVVDAVTNGKGKVTNIRKV